MHLHWTKFICISVDENQLHYCLSSVNYTSIIGLKSMKGINPYRIAICLSLACPLPALHLSITQRTRFTSRSSNNSQQTDCGPPVEHQLLVAWKFTVTVPEGPPDQLTVPYHWDPRPTDCTQPPGSHNHTKHTGPPGPLPDQPHPASRTSS